MQIRATKGKMCVRICQEFSTACSISVWSHRQAPSIVVHEGTTKQYLQMANLKDGLLALIPKSPDAPF
jgi:hypothetical protein